MDIDTLCDIRKGDYETLTISKNATCGLVQYWDGSGSVLEIQLDHNVVIPKKMVWDAWVDGTKPHGYDVDEIYGLIGSAWNGEVKLVA